jgi:hypothetical protein
MSWEPGCSPQMMTAITSSLEPFWDGDYGQLEHICPLDCLNMHTCWAVVARACNPSYSGGRDQEGGG